MFSSRIHPEEKAENIEKCFIVLRKDSRFFTDHIKTQYGDSLHIVRSFCHNPLDSPFINWLLANRATRDACFEFHKEQRKGLEASQQLESNHSLCDVNIRVSAVFNLSLEKLHQLCDSICVQWRHRNILNLAQRHRAQIRLETALDEVYIEMQNESTGAWGFVEKMTPVIKGKSMISPR